MLVGVLFVALIVLLMLGMDISLVLITSSVIVIALSYFTEQTGIFFEVIPQYMYSGVDSFSITAIPLFIFAGEIMNRCGITDKLVSAANRFVGHIRGGMGQASVVLNVIMAGISGSSVADCTATGSVLIPALKKDGYTPEQSAAIVASASTIGSVIPPSIPLIIIGSTVGISVGQLFIAGIIPGLLMGTCLMIFLYIQARKNGMKPKPKSSVKERLSGTKDAFLGLMIPIIIITCIMTGLVSPTESAVLAVLYALGISLIVYKTLNLSSFKEICISTVRTSGSVLLIVAAGTIFGWLATYLGIGSQIENFILSVTDNPIIILLMVNVILLILGMVLEAIPIIVLVSPIFFPILTDIGIDPVHFSIILVVNLMIGLLTPPVGLHLFITSSIAKVSMGKVIKAVAPMVIVLLIVLGLITFIPSISTFLPSLLS